MLEVYRWILQNSRIFFKTVVYFKHQFIWTYIVFVHSVNYGFLEKILCSFKIFSESMNLLSKIFLNSFQKETLQYLWRPSMLIVVVVVVRCCSCSNFIPFFKIKMSLSLWWWRDVMLDLNWNLEKHGDYQRPRNKQRQK